MSSNVSNEALEAALNAYSVANYISFEDAIYSPQLIDYETPENILIRQEEMRSLSDDAKEIIRICLSGGSIESELTGWDGRLRRELIRKYVGKVRGWSTSRINMGMRDGRKHLECLNDL